MQYVLQAWVLTCIPESIFCTTKIKAQTTISQEESILPGASRAEQSSKTASRPLHCFCQYPKLYAAQQALRSARSSPKNKIVPDWPESKDTSLYTSNMCPLPRWMHCIHGTPMVQVYGTRTNACTGASPFARIDPRLYRG